MAMNSTTKAALAICLLALGSSPAVWAQATADNDTVASRQRDGLDPLGLRLGAFRLFPDVALEYLRDDNILAARENPESDNILVVKPSLRLQSDWSRNLLQAGVNAQLHDYSSFPGEDHDNYEAFLRGRWDTVSGSFFYTELSRSINHEGRDSADDQRGLERIRFKRSDIELGYRYKPGRALVQLEAEVSDFNFEDVVGPEGPINEDDRDREKRNVSLRLGYGIADGYLVFLQGTWRETDYEDRFDDNGFERSSDGYEAVFGATLNLTKTVFGDIFVGRKSHEYDDPNFVDIGGTAFGIDIGWNMTRLTTLAFVGRQEVVPTTVPDAAGIDQTRLRVRADHELLRNLILSLGWNMRIDDFKGIERRDDLDGVRFGARYLMNRKLNLEFGYTRSTRDSNILLDREFSRHVVSIEVKGQL